MSAVSATSSSSLPPCSPGSVNLPPGSTIARASGSAVREKSHDIRKLVIPSRLSDDDS
jgi:hypothetical protein